MPDKSKFEREIDEILEKNDADDSIRPAPIDQSRKASKPKTFEPFTGTAPKRSQKSKKRSSSISIKPGNLTIAGVVILAVAAFTPSAQIPIALVGVGLLVIGYVLWFRTGASHLGDSTSSTGITGMFRRNRSPKEQKSSEPQVKYWRGRRIEEKPEPPDSNDSDERGKIIDFRSPSDDDK